MSDFFVSRICHLEGLLQTRMSEQKMQGDTASANDDKPMGMGEGERERESRRAEQKSRAESREKWTSDKIRHFYKEQNNKTIETLSARFCQEILPFSALVSMRPPSRTTFTAST